LIASWPAAISGGSVSHDLISSVDFLPTICEVAGVSVPAGSDGISFLPQLRGLPGTPRTWLYSWYSPRQGADMTVREFTFDHRYKLYRDGRFFDLAHDPDETAPIRLATATAETVAVANRLQAALDLFHDARPPELDRQYQETMDNRSASPAKKKQKR
jgi:arylsulfatase A